MNYLLLGPEEYLKNQFIEKLKKTAPAKDKNTAFEYETYYGGESELSSILGSLNTLPFFSNKRIIIVKNAEKIPVKERKPVLQYLKAQKGTNIFILESSSTERESKFLREIAAFTKLIKCERPKDRDLDMWIRKEFECQKKRIPQEFGSLIRELVGRDMSLLKNAIEKVVLYTGDSKGIKESDIEIVLGKPTYKKAFELIDLIAERKIGKILEGLDKLLIKEKPHEVLNLLAWQFRNFLKLKKSKNTLSIEEAARVLNTSAWLLCKIKETSHKFTLVNLKKYTEIILEADLSIKRGKMDPRHALERVLVSLCGQVTL